MNNREELEYLRSDVLSLADQAQSEFGRLRVDQLNWKPAPTTWSVAQCFHHLITTNASYFPTFDSIATRQKKSNVLERKGCLSCQVYGPVSY
jgi:hypothetical protein